jgi:pimeloyl-ACP methyl ester carboxylesterase
MPPFEPVSFVNAQGLRLAGTLHRPREARADLPAVVLLSPGVKMRVGPGRLYVPITQLLNEQGYTVLRFDFYGLGDSEGELGESQLIDIYNHVEVGRYVEDTMSAMRYLRETHGFRSFMLGGLCGGATTAALTAERDPGVTHLLCIGLAIALSSDAATPARYLTRVELDSRRQQYYRRLLQPKSWLRLLTFKSEYGVIWRSLKRLVFKDKAKKQTSVTEPVKTPALENANPLFPPAFFAFLRRGGKALLLFSEKDRLPSEFEEKFTLPYAASLEPFLPQLTSHVIPSANHVLSMPEWRKEALAVCQRWLDGSASASQAAQDEAGKAA